MAKEINDRTVSEINNYVDCMAEIMDEFIGKLYDKADIEKWELPEKTKEQIGLKENKYFFLTSSREEKHGMRHVHFSIYQQNMK